MDELCRECGHERENHVDDQQCETGAYLEPDDHCDCLRFVGEENK